MKRRDFIALGGAAAVFPHIALAQQRGRVPRIAYLSIPQPDTYLEALRQGLSAFHYVEGANIAVQFFTAPSTADLPKYAEMAVASRPDVIVVQGTPAGLAANGATSMIPIVLASVNDPIRAALIDRRGNPSGQKGLGAFVVPIRAARSLKLDQRHPFDRGSFGPSV